MRQLTLGFLLAAILVPSLSCVRAQNQPGATSLTPTPTMLKPERKPYRQQIETYLATRTSLSSAAKQAFITEMAREKAGYCKDARSISEAVDCLSKQGQITSTNYVAMTTNLRALLALAPSDDAEASPPVAGPTGEPLTPAQQALEYDRLQQNWDVYRKAVVSAAYDQFKGGTEAPVSAALADLIVVRSHMKELASIYDFILGNH